MARFTIEQLPDLTGQTAIVTGANSGLGLESARVLALRGATVIMACRNAEKAESARLYIATDATDERLRVRVLDLASLESVRIFAEVMAQECDRIDILMNNAGVMALPHGLTEDGFELQFGTNHLGHFALTGLLLPLLAAAPRGRVVGVTSIAANGGKIAFDDLHGERRYSRYAAYCQSKLANLLHIRELDRRLQAVRSPVVAVAAHPGVTHTELQANTAAASGSWVEKAAHRFGSRWVTMPVEKGTLPQLYAAAMPDAEPGAMYGPSGIQQAWGWPAKVKQPRRAHDTALGERLWGVSEELTGVTYPGL